MASQASSPKQQDVIHESCPDHSNGSTPLPRRGAAGGRRGIRISCGAGHDPRSQSAQVRPGGADSLVTSLLPPSGLGARTTRSAAESTCGSQGRDGGRGGVWRSAPPDGSRSTARVDRSKAQRANHRSQRPQVGSCLSSFAQLSIPTPFGQHSTVANPWRGLGLMGPQSSEPLMGDKPPPLSDMSRCSRDWHAPDWASATSLRGWYQQRGRSADH